MTIKRTVLTLAILAGLFLWLSPSLAQELTETDQGAPVYQAGELAGTGAPVFAAHPIGSGVPAIAGESGGVPTMVAVPVPVGTGAPVMPASALGTGVLGAVGAPVYAAAPGGLSPGAPVYTAAQLMAPGAPLVASSVLSAANRHGMIGGGGGGGCLGGCDGSCDSCGPVHYGKTGIWHRLCCWDGYVDVDYLHWWSKGRRTPPLATTSAPNTPRPAAGVLGMPSTQTLFGNNRVGTDENNGLRVNFGLWLDQHHTMAIGGKFFGLNGQDEGFTGNSVTTPILGVPFFDLVRNSENTLLAGFPNELAGRIDIRSEIDVLGAEAFSRIMVWRGCGYRLDLLGGYHFTRVDDNLTISSFTTSLPGDTNPTTTPGQTFDVRDNIEARNKFHGGELGLLAEFYNGPIKFTALGKCSFGNMQHSVRYQGRTIVTTPNAATSTRVGGLFTQPSNIGLYEDNEYAFVPEAQLTLSYWLAKNVEVSLGYSFIYWTRVVLAGDEIDRTVNRLQAIGGPQRPQFPGFRDTDFWLQGINVGGRVSF